MRFCGENVTDRRCMSASSSSEEATGGGGGGGGAGESDPVQLAQKIHKRLASDPAVALPVQAHYRATHAMARLQHALTATRAARDEGGGHEGDDETATRAVLMALTCAGVAVARRIALAHEQDPASELQTTLALLMVLVTVAAAGRAADGGPDALTHDPLQTLRAHEDRSTAAALDAAAATARSADWKGALDAAASDPAHVCRSVLGALHFQTTPFDLPQLAAVALVFFRASAGATAIGLFDAVAPGRFVSMSVGGALALEPARRDERLAAVVSAAESEAGQTILRDLQLSFLLPRRVVGVRRAVLLPRATNASVTAGHATVLNAAHESALRGAEWEWAHSESETVRACALLAGLAVLLSRGDVRKEDAFAGRVALPFLETLPPGPEVVRIALVESRGEWICWRQRAGGAGGAGGGVEVLTRRAGHDGLLDAVLVCSARL